MTNRPKASSFGFTIVELLMVVGVIAILAGIVTTAATSAIRNARGRRAAAMLQVLEAGLNAYYSRNGEWPGSKLQDLADNGNGNRNQKVYTLSASEADDTFRKLVSESVKPGAAPYLDPAGLYVATKTVADKGEARSGSEDPMRGGTGQNFRDSFVKQKGAVKMSIGDMAFGYQQKKTGWFRRFRISYNQQTDSVKVSRQSYDVDDED